ncbi:protein OS-9 [Emericellopsis atlantica]|uniref:Endoplasmic reticulum lectin n=1 Tax=Emericellopsis atlantica TaxID=2614577 RepID=A0A9P8CT99_9HYPO|nr:protein OS-9 [Emericellopsis atlantica]KAG9256606.1 protein OS-9 [Emericellopsis atlantica]
MRRRNAALLVASLRLGGAQARSFSVHEDLLAFPQFDVVFDEQWISKDDAQSLIAGDAPHATQSTDISHATTEGNTGPPEHDDAGKEFKIMKLAAQEYLCSIPMLQPDAPENETANELAKAEEARELSRATLSGWELLGDLAQNCLYFGSGWWTYRFCNNVEIVQFHAAATPPLGRPPIRDKSTAEYVLGAVPSLPHSTTSREQLLDEDDKPVPAEVQTKADQKYLVQKLEGGTVCDLTGRERTIEVQYHCVPGLREPRISWIKEVTICAYLMVVNTPRLCKDVAFLPPKEITANPISCQLIVEKGSSPPLLGEEQTADADGANGWMPQKEDQSPLKAPWKKQQVVGGVVVGARNILSGGDEQGKPPVQLNTPRNHLGNTFHEEGLIELVAKRASKAEGGKVEAMDQDEMETYEIDPQMVEEMRQEVERLAGDLGWRIEIVELPNEDRELRGYVDDDQSDKGDEEGSEERMKDEL